MQKQNPIDIVVGIINDGKIELTQKMTGYVITRKPDPIDLLTSTPVNGQRTPAIDTSALLRWKLTMIMIAFPLLHLGGWAVWSLLEGNPDFPIRVFNLLTVMVLGGLVWSIQPQPK